MKNNKEKVSKEKGNKKDKKNKKKEKPSEFNVRIGKGSCAICN
jgi:hypothetical protein